MKRPGEMIDLIREFGNEERESGRMRRVEPSIRSLDLLEEILVELWKWDDWVRGKATEGIHIQKDFYSKSEGDDYHGKSRDEDRGTGGD